MRLSDFRALTFDVYGTLIDWETGITSALRPLTDRLSGELTRDQILEAHARNESSQQRFTPTKPYSEVLAVVYRRLAEEWRIPVSWEECVAYGASVESWPAFPDSANALEYLKRHYRLFVLSNVDNESFARSNEKLGVAFDGVFTAEDIGSYKPDERNFTYMLERLDALGIASARVLHTAESLFHDHTPANRFGLACCHIYRRAGKEGFGATMPPADPPRIDFRFNSMAELAEAHASERS